ncbi:MAG: hypothetical protein U0524_00935 [Candidatus Saccharimonadales bacterium]
MNEIEAEPIGGDPIALETEKSTFTSAHLHLAQDDVRTLLTPIDEVKGINLAERDHERLVSRIYRDVEATNSAAAITWIIDQAAIISRAEEQQEESNKQAAQLIDLLAAMPETIPADTRSTAWEHLLSKDLSEEDVLLAEESLRVVHEEDDTMREPAKKLFHRTFDIFVKAHNLDEEKDTLKREFMRNVVRDAILPTSTQTEQVDAIQNVRTI